MRIFDPEHLNRYPNGIRVVIGIFSLIWMAGISNAAGGRTAVQILTDIKSTEQAFPNYEMEGRLDPRFKAQMTGQFAGLLKRTLDLIDELEVASPRDAVQLREAKCMFLAQLSLYDNADALKKLTDLSNSAVPADQCLGKVGLLAFKWWSSKDEAAQKEIVSQLETVAKSNPKDDVVFGMALKMARYLAASDEVANALRDIVDKDLKGPAAVKYQKQPEKIGRPFKISVKTLSGATLSTSDWKGKVVLIDFWATWCPPCRAALPDLIKTYREKHDKGLEVLGISNDSQLPALKQFLAGNKEMVWPESFNPTGPGGWNALSPKMNVASIPTTFLIDRDGILRDIKIGAAKEKLLQQLLDEQPKTDAKANTPAVADHVSAPATQPIGATGASPIVTAPAPAPAVSSSESDPKANALLSLAKNYIAAKRDDLARGKLNELLKKYPNTDASKKAKDLLAHLKVDEQ